MRIYFLIKKIMDFSVALLILTSLFPILIIITLLVWFKMGSPVIFAQRRPGYKGKPFTLYKFRTMQLSKSKSINIKEDYKRLNKFGKFLRNTSIDEFPSLINIIKGEMSFVGPRPLLMEYLDLYNEEQFRRHNVKPGITGLAQINGRNNLNWIEKFEKDIYYVDNINLFMDLKIIFLTFLKVIEREGINSPGEATAKLFTGNQK